MKKFADAFLSVPNIPFLLVLMVFCLHHRDVFQEMDSDELMDSLKKLYPFHFQCFIAIIGYSSLIIQVCK